MTTTYTYDVQTMAGTLGNVVSIASPGNDAATTRTKYFNYTDPIHTTPQLGEPLSLVDELNHTTLFQYDAQANRISTTDANNHQTTATYDYGNRPLVVTMPWNGQPNMGAETITYTYLFPGGPMLSQAIATGIWPAKTVNYSYDNNYHLTSISGDADNVTYNYDSLNRLKTVTDGIGNITSYSYDAVGNVTSISTPAANQTTNTVHFSNFDAAGRVGTRTDANGMVTNYTYATSTGWLTNIQYPVTPALNVQFYYNNIGRRLAMTDGSGMTAYTYDALGMPLTINTSYNNMATEGIGYTYNPDGSRATMNTPAGQFTYHYYANGLPLSVINPYNETSSWTYQNNNWLQCENQGNGAQVNYAQNALGQLTGQSYSVIANNIATTYASYNNFSYDSQGNRVGENVAILNQPNFSGNAAYVFANTGQLCQEQTLPTTNLMNTSYDNAGNPTILNNVNHTFQQMNQLADTGVAYDNNGNPTTYHAQTLNFDPENRMTAYGVTTNPNSAIMYAGYTGDGLRAWKQGADQANPNYFLYDGNQPVCEFVNGTLSAVNTFGATGLLSRKDILNNREIWYQFNPEGNVAQRFDQNGNLLSTQTDLYDAWGNPLATGDSLDPFGYKGQAGYYTDHETGLILCGFRYYDPAEGRWINQDPIGFRGGTNLYGYCSDNPITYIDILGFCKYVNDVGQANQTIQGNTPIAVPDMPLPCDTMNPTLIGNSPLCPKDPNICSPTPYTLQSTSGSSICDTTVFLTANGEEYRTDSELGSGAQGASYQELINRANQHFNSQAMLEQQMKSTGEIPALYNGL